MLMFEQNYLRPLYVLTEPSRALLMLQGALPVNCRWSYVGLPKSDILQQVLGWTQ